jgi:hypothetical protein
MSNSNETAKKNPVPKNFQNNTITNSRGYSKPKTEINVITPIEGGAIGTGRVAIEKKINKDLVTKKVAEKVALFSNKNVYWPGLGKILKGYNIVKKDLSAQWLTLSYIREATPEEVAREYGA